MIRTGLTRRRLLRAGAGLGTFAIIGRTKAATPYKPSDSLVDAARKEGRFVLYTATFTEVEQEVINEFRKKFPFIRVEMIRAPGGQLITRVKTEAAAGKLSAVGVAAIGCAVGRDWLGRRVGGGGGAGGSAVGSAVGSGAGIAVGTAVAVGAVATSWAVAVAIRSSVPAMTKRWVRTLGSSCEKTTPALS